MLANEQTVFCEQEMVDPNVSMDQVIQMARKPSDKCKHAFIEVTRIFPDKTASIRSRIGLFHHFEVPYADWVVKLNKEIKRKASSAVIIRTGSRVTIRYRRAEEWFVAVGVIDTPSSHPTSDLPEGVSIIDITLQPGMDDSWSLCVFLKSVTKLNKNSLLAVFKQIVPIAVEASVEFRQDDVTYNASGTNLWSTLVFSPLPSTEEELRKLPYLRIFVRKDQ